MRTFIAIDLPAEIKSALGRTQAKLKESGADVKWVKPENIHLTLKFLGERDEKKVQAIASLLEDALKDKKSIQASISSFGGFPKIESPRVIWAGIEKGDIEIKQIAAVLEEAIAKAGIPKEDRAFSSHITIGRTRSSLNKDRLIQGLTKCAEGLKNKNLEFNITKITLFKSTLTPAGPIYEAIKEINLKTI